MKRLTLAIALAGTLLTLNGCIPYPPPLGHPGAYYNNVPYNAYGGYGYGGGYGYPPYGYIGVVPRFYGGFRGGFGGRGRR